MGLETLAYPFIFAAIYFEVFLLITFLSAPARAGRAREASLKTPSVAMIVPCYNEEHTIAGTVESLLALEYPKEKLSILLVDDGSTDGTAAVMDRYRDYSQIQVIHTKNGGKHTALNTGIAASSAAELVGCLDADSFVEKSALREIISCFDDANVGAATSAMSVHAPRTMLEQMQNAEYILGIALRHILAAVNGIYVTPGPFSLYRRDIVVALGGFREGHNTEDMEMALRIQRAGYTIENAPRARVFTKAPHTVPKLIKQRTRWTTGFIRNMLYDYRDLVGNPQYGSLGLLVLPLGFAAILGGLTLFFLAAYQAISHVITTLTVSYGVPLSYTFLPRIGSLEFEWFYLPTTAFLILTAIATIGSLAFLFVGRTISKTPARLAPGLVAYVLLYALIAPLWLMRSVADVAVGIHRTWR